MLKAIFFDLGSTLWDDYPATLDMWKSVARLLTRDGVPTSLSDMVDHSHSVIASYSPSLTRAIVWQRLNGDPDRYQRVMDDLIAEILLRFNDADEFRRMNPLFAGVPELLGSLAQRYRLGVISQHFTEVRQWISYHGIEQHFEHLAISGSEQLYKPDPRLYILACEALGVEPGEAMMVGDRLDNDIFPANRIGMTTVRVMNGPYVIQQERYHRDAPDYTISGINELPGILSEIDH